MILDQLCNAGLYRSLGERFTRAFEYLETFDPSTPDGRHDLEGDDLFMLVQTFTSVPPSEKNFETHRHYTDIQYVVAGEETIWYQPAPLLRPKTPYDPARDIQFFDGAEDRPLILGPGDFAVFWPQDGHKPACVRDMPCQVRKVVAKIRARDAMKLS